MSGAAADVLGVVLAGGGSRRFGSPKALATLHGEPLWRRAVRVVGELEVPVLVLANDARVAGHVRAAGIGPDRVEVTSDLRPDAGPLAGVETGLVSARERGHAGVLVLACDLVRVDGALLTALVGAWTGEGAAAFEAPEPWGLAPLCSLWGVDLLPDVSRALDAGRSSPGELLLALDARCVSAADTRSHPDPAALFRSANRPEDLAEIESELHAP